MGTWGLKYICESVSFHRNADTAIGGMVCFTWQRGTRHWKIGILQVQVPVHIWHDRTEEPAQQDSLSLESLISAADTSSCVPARDGDIKFQLTLDNLLPDWVQETSFLCGCQRSTSTRAHGLGCRSTCWASDLFAHHWVNNLFFPNCQELGFPPDTISQERISCHQRPRQEMLGSGFYQEMLPW